MKSPPIMEGFSAKALNYGAGDVTRDGYSGNESNPLAKIRSVIGAS